MISLAHSSITEQVRDNVNACLDENRIGQGRFNKQFEEDAAKYLGAKHGIVVNNGSMADIVALGALKTKYPDRYQVIVPAYTFVAQTNAILINGLQPVFVDVGDDYQMDMSQVESKINDKTLCIFAVHLFGKACDIYELKELANKYDIALVEDCCEAFGGEAVIDYNALDQYGMTEPVTGKLGTVGDFGTYSFFPSHTITSLDYGEKIIIKNKGTGFISNVKIGDFVTKEDYTKHQCVSFNKEGDLSFQNITGTIEHPVNEKLYKLKLQTGRETIVSASHSVFTDGNGIEPIRVSELKVGDSVFVPNNLKCFGEDTKTVTTPRYKRGSWEYYGETVELSEELSWLLGWYVAEGWSGKNSMPNYPVAFTLHKKEIPIAENIIRISKKIFDAKLRIYAHGENAITIRGSSRSMYEFFTKWCGKYAYGKVVPQFLFTAPLNIKKTFLDAYYEGDGCEHPTFTNGGGFSMDSKTVSRELAEGIYYLLLSIGINPRISKEDAKTDVVILGYTCDTRDVYSVCYSKNSIINSVSFRGGKRQKKYNDISLVKILSIEEVESTTPNVYDLTVEGYENFVGSMAVCLHNTGEGGMIVTDDDELAALARQVSNHGRRGDNILDKFHFDVFGYNGKMSNVLAAIGCAILPTVNEVIEKRRNNVELYNKILKNDWYATSPHCYPVRYNTEKERDDTLMKLWDNGVEARKAFSSLPTQEKVYSKWRFSMGDFPMAEKFGKTVLFLPVHQGLTEEDINYITKLL